MSGYHDNLDWWGCTMLKMARRDPWKAKECFVDRTRKPADISDKPWVAIGSAVHEILLEKKEIDDVVTHIPIDCLTKAGRVNATKFAEVRELNPERRFVRDEDYERIVRVCNSVLRHPLGELLSKDLKFEQAEYWHDQVTGLPCKAKPDFLYIDDDRAVIYDLKVSEQVSPKSWERVAKNLEYWYQDAHYSNGIATLFGRPVSFVFWVLESKEPYRIAKYSYDSISRERAFESYQGSLLKLSSRIENNDWSESWESGTNSLTLSPWDVDSAEQDLEGFEDD